MTQDMPPIEDAQKHREEIERWLHGFLRAVLIRKEVRFTIKDNWLEIERLEAQNYHPSDDKANSYKWKTFCACNIMETYPGKLHDRIVLQLFSQLASAKQDINGLFDEYTIIKKPIF